MSENIIYGIMSAMPEEIDGVISLIHDPQHKSIAGRTYTSGTINDKNVVVVFSRWGKVAAASTSTTLIDYFKVDKIVFTGIAGAIHDDLNVGDIVVADSCVFHDMDTRPLNERFVVPIINKKFFELNVSDSWYLKLVNIFHANNINQIIDENWISLFNLRTVQVVRRSIATGDQFVNSEKMKDDLRTNLPVVACVEMEGAAVAQICFEYNIPCSIVRTISDSANNTAAMDFMPFAKHVASSYSVAIVTALLSD